MDRETLMKLDDTVYEDVPIPEWGDGVHFAVRSLTGTERDEFESSMMRKTTTTDKRGKKREKYKLDTANVRARLVRLAVCKAVGDPTPVFQSGDEDWLGLKNGSAIDKLYDVAARLSRIVIDEDDIAGN